MIHNICIIDTPFSLALYLLKMPMKDILQTKFINVGSVDKRITNRLPNNCVYYDGANIINDWKKLFFLRIGRWFKLPCLLWANIYAQDHIYVAPQLIGKRKYTLITDAPDFFYKGMLLGTQPFTPPQGKGIKEKIKYFLTIWHTIYGQMYGTNKQCIDRWVIGENEQESIFLRGRAYQMVDGYTLWNDSSTEKKQFIASLFSLTEDILETSKKAEVFVLTQPFREDCNLTDEEYMSIYGSIVTKYSNILVKPHPRDKFDWEKYYPETSVLRTLAPMQLLNYMGVCPKKAITVFSTAISTMPKECEKIYLGSKVNEKIFARFGDFANS